MIPFQSNEVQSIAFEYKSNQVQSVAFGQELCRLLRLIIILWLEGKIWSSCCLSNHDWYSLVLMPIGAQWGYPTAACAGWRVTFFEYSLSINGKWILPNGKWQLIVHGMGSYICAALLNRAIRVWRFYSSGNCFSPSASSAVWPDIIFFVLSIKCFGDVFSKEKMFLSPSFYCCTARYNLLLVSEQTVAGVGIKCFH